LASVTIQHLLTKLHFDFPQSSDDGKTFPDIDKFFDAVVWERAQETTWDALRNCAVAINIDNLQGTLDAMKGEDIFKTFYDQDNEKMDVDNKDDDNVDKEKLMIDTDGKSIATRTRSSRRTEATNNQGTPNSGGRVSFGDLVASPITVEGTTVAGSVLTTADVQSIVTSTVIPMVAREVAKEIGQLQENMQGSLSLLFTQMQQNMTQFQQQQQQQQLVFQQQQQQQLQQQEDSSSTVTTTVSTLELTDENLEILEDCRMEIRRIYSEKLQCEEKLVDAILPKDIEDMTYDAIIEIRAGTGGDEASLFAREIWDCYMKSIKTIHKQWKVDILTETMTDLGGLKDGSLLISGNSISIELDSPTLVLNENNNSEDVDLNNTANVSNDNSVTRHKTITEELGPYGFFKFESGVHRVQRIPVNAVRIHTSACSIAVLPSMKDDTVDKNELLPMSELKIETMRAHGAGGQHINTTDSAVRITHIPTGIQAAIQDERSQHKNKAKALKLITARVRDLKRIEQEQQLGQQRTQLMGGGDRSERIRTYNYPQDRITDHRCKVNLQNITALLTCQKDSLEDGLVISFLPYLKMMRREELLQQLEE
jgi:peptide chain release factor 1